jgi:Mn2+/Fe2+ NRAMP family transporter
VLITAVGAAISTVLAVILGVVEMPHNLFLHSEIIRSRQWNLQDEGVVNEPYNLKDCRSRAGLLIAMVPATLSIFLISSPSDGLIYSRMLLSIQLPIAIFTQVYLTSPKAVMGSHANGKGTKILLWAISLIAMFLSIAMLVRYL